jgi:hypothetical protein
MNALSLLASLAKSVDNGKWGCAKDGQYDFVVSGETSIIPSRTLEPHETACVQDLFHPVGIDVARVHLGRLALIKKIGGASEATMSNLIGDMAFELCEFSEMAILLAFKEIKRTEGPWMPELGFIIKKCEKWQKFVDGLFADCSHQIKITHQKRGA